MTLDLTEISPGISAQAAAPASTPVALPASAPGVSPVVSAVPAPAPRAVWTAVCRLGDLAPERGVAALVDGEQVALFRLVDGTVLAVQQHDPFSGAHVLSRGIVGTRGDAPTVASPMYKQVFDLRTGRCLDGVGRDPQDLRTWPVRVENDVVLVGTPRDPGRAPAGGSGERAGEPAGGSGEPAGGPGEPADGAGAPGGASGDGGAR